MNLQEFFQENPRVAIAFSGGVDSSYLLYAAKQYAAEVQAYYVAAEFQPQFEYDDAMRLAKEVGADVRVLSISALEIPKVKENPANRCYYCKQGIFGAIWNAAKEDGFTVLLDGTNASDDAGDRPGMKALQELSVRSPLRECGLTKAQIRELSKAAGLFTWNKPAYACLATRIPTGEVITKEKLEATEKAEGFLFALGFTDFRVRSREGHARIQLPEAQWPLLLQRRAEILEELKKYYVTVSLDLEVRG
ncbi:MAG: ATP-dependent sacrificial sulfur transferase LarE [Lachnospiraceae bacterium]|nr:ATP-dependent sacrificial sulfur transferase LarE [Lachnospiraceae bacterium]